MNDLNTFEKSHGHHGQLGPSLINNDQSDQEKSTSAMDICNFLKFVLRQESTYKDTVEFFQKWSYGI